LEYAGHGPVGRPCHKAQTAARFANARQFARRDIRPGGKHDAKAGRNRIEAGVVEWQRFGITNAEIDVRRQRLCRLDHAGADIDAGHRRTARCEQPRRPPSAGCHVEKPFARLRHDTVHEMGQCIGTRCADPVVIAAAGTPGCRGSLIVRQNICHDPSLSAPALP
jgi:hypothetical protein